MKTFQTHCKSTNLNAKIWNISPELSNIYTWRRLFINNAVYKFSQLSPVLSPKKLGTK